MRAPNTTRSYLPPRANALLFYSFTAILLIPLWVFHYFPSQDGPMHQYNALVLRSYYNPTQPAFAEYFVPNLMLVPNWVCPHLLPVLVRFFSPIVAEKLLLSVYLILFPISVRYALGAIRPRARLLSLAVLPMVPNQFYHLGFQDFCLALAGFFLVAGYFLKHRRHFTWKNSLLLACMLLLLYLVHLVSVVMVLGLIGLTALATYFPGRANLAYKFRRLLPVIIAMLPVILWAAYFALKPHHGDDLVRWPKGWHHRFFLIPLWMKSYQYRELIAGFAMLFRRQHRRALFTGLPGGLIATTLFYLLIFLLGPDAFAGAQVLLIRVAAYVFFALLLWWAALPLGSRSFARLELLVALVSIPAAIFLLASHVASYRELNQYLPAFEAVAPLIPPGSTIVPVHYNDPYTLSAPTGDNASRHPLSTGIDPFRHAATFGLAQRGIIDLGNSWASTDHQSLKWRAGLNPMNIEFDRVDDFLAYSQRTGRPVDYVLIWTGGIPHDDAQSHLIDQQLAAAYELIYTSPDNGYLKLYRSTK